MGKRFRIADALVWGARVVWDGEAFVVVWQQDGALYATAIEGDSTVTQTVASDGVLDFAAVNAGGSVLIAYARQAPEAGYTSRIFTRMWSRPRLRAIRPTSAARDSDHGTRPTAPARGGSALR